MYGRVVAFRRLDGHTDCDCLSCQIVSAFRRFMVEQGVPRLGFPRWDFLVRMLLTRTFLSKIFSFRMLLIRTFLVRMLLFRTFLIRVLLMRTFLVSRRGVEESLCFENCICLMPGVTSDVGRLPFLVPDECLSF